MKSLSLALAAAIVLVAPSAFGAADLSLSLIAGPSPVRAGFATSFNLIIRNNGPDTARDVKITLATSTGDPTTCVCEVGTLQAGTANSRSVGIVAPASGTVSVTATASSSTPDDNLTNNTVVDTFSVSNDPDVTVSLGAPARQDLMLPFTLLVRVGNFSNTAAHDVDVTIGYRSDVQIRTLPADCISPVDGRIVCHAGVVQPNDSRNWSIALVAPQFYNDGRIAFTAIATEAEHDFDPLTNTATFVTTLYKTFFVANTADDNRLGSLRRAITDANADCASAQDACAIIFRIEEPSPNPWKTIRVLTPLPQVMAPAIRIDGSTQGALAGRNPNGPSIELTGNAAAGDGLVIAGCDANIGGLAINGFPGNGVSVVDGPNGSPRCAAFKATLHDLYVGTDPTGSTARPNLRGIGTSFRNGPTFGESPATVISNSVISGNERSGIFGLSGRLSIAANRIGVKAHSDEPLPNGNAGVYVGPGASGSDVGPSVFGELPNPTPTSNVIAYNGQMGVAIAASAFDVAVRANRIWGNAGLGIDIGLDGASQPAGSIPTPVITLAHYDPAARTTVIEGDFAGTPGATFAPAIDLFANDASDPSGFGEGQRPLGGIRLTNSSAQHFRATVNGDLTGQFVTATATRINFVGFTTLGLAMPVPEGIEQGFLTQTSEFSRTVEVR